jgi:hypothetical protein
MSEAAALIVDHHSIRHQSLKSRGIGQKIDWKHRSGAGRKYVGGERRKSAYLIPPLRKD